MRRPLALLAAVVLVYCTAACVSASQPRKPAKFAPISFWNWQESVVDPDHVCGTQFRHFLQHETTGLFAQGGRQYLSTAFSLLCSDPVNVQRKAVLPRFVSEQHSNFNSTVDFLFGQSHDNNSTSGLGLWFSAAVDVIRQVQSAGLQTPALRMDIEYNPTSEDMLRVLKMAAWLRGAVDTAFPNPAQRPMIAWALNFASMLPINTSYAPCPAAGANNKVMLGGECFLLMVDHVDLMDFRSYAVQEPVKGDCDGQVLYAIPFFAAAAKLHKTVSIGAETDCDLGKYTYKLSFCAPAQAFHTEQPLQYMYDSLDDTRKYLSNTTRALQDFPCAAQASGPLAAIEPGHDYWSAAAAPRPFVVEDLFAWNYLAYNNTNNAPLNCPGQAYASWQECVTPAMAARSPTRDL